MRSGDVLGHEFKGEAVEVGPAVRDHAVGDRVTVCSFISCGQCWYCSTSPTANSTPSTSRPTCCPLEEGPRGYQMFKDMTDGCVRAVFQPGA